ncbi:hypothetical protein ABIC28_004423 [Rhodococcus sp. PvR044]|uniref:DUF2567 domain-containing protein n=1 Tax=Rhodococcus TaxID=1827 RepID=UPI001B468E8C|nr:MULTISPECIES: DUF2567 domain-containing protein [Rhodococcus]MBP1159167.1 hypothetical protein [Rhodococcus sp. PvR099]MCZ4558637.1 DUF2567 domain-containing protein [Rhodococcus maanshanensis]
MAVDRSEIRAAARIVVAVVAASALAGIGWGLLVPAQHFLVISGGRAASLTSESGHQFDAVALFLCAGLTVGVLSASAAWLWRSVRGPVVLIGLLIGSAVGAATTAVVGLGVAGLRFPDLPDAIEGQIVPVSPGLGTAMVLILQPLVAAFVYLVLASMSPRDDLGVAPASDESAPAGDLPGPMPQQVHSGLEA